MGIRKAELKDKSSVAKIFADENEHHFNLQPDVFNRLSIANILPDGWYEEILESESFDIYVYDENEVVMGLVMLSKAELLDELYRIQKWVYINELAVYKDFRGKGIGKKLLAFAEEYSNHIGCKTVKLEVWSNNDSAIGLYEKQGYKLKKNIYWKTI